MEFTENLNLVGFDLAYAYEAMARAYAATGKRDECEKYLKMAEEIGVQIKGDENKKIFVADFSSEPWFRMK